MSWQQGGLSEEELGASLEAELVDWMAADNEYFAEQAEGDPSLPKVEFQVDRGYTTCREGVPDRFKSEKADWLCVSRITDEDAPSKVVHTWTVEPTEGDCWEAELVEYEYEESGHLVGPAEVRELGAMCVPGQLQVVRQAACSMMSR